MLAEHQGQFLCLQYWYPVLPRFLVGLHLAKKHSFKKLVFSLGVGTLTQEAEVGQLLSFRPRLSCIVNSEPTWTTY